MKPQSTSKKIKVLLLAPRKAVGGIASWTRRLLELSLQDRVEYKVIDTSKLYEPLGKELICRGMLLGVRDAILRFFRITYSLWNYRPQLVYITMAPSIGLFIRDVPLMFFLKCLGVGCVCHLRGGNLFGFWGRDFLRRWITIRAFRTCRAILVITREVEKYARDQIDSKIVFYVPNMIEDKYVVGRLPKRIFSVEEKPVLNLIHVGWQAPKKGSLDIVEAIKYLKSDVKCYLVGKASSDNERLIQKRIEELNVGDKIQLIGQKTGTDIQSIYEAADIFLFPTHKEGPEGFPNVILEAMAYGLPIIANDVGNIREMIGYDTEYPAGLLLEQIDPVLPMELADKIDRLVKDHSLRQQMSINGRKRVKENYLASKVIPNLESLLVELAVAKPTPQSINHIFEQQYL